MNVNGNGNTEKGAEEMRGEHLLLTALGTNPRTALYSLGDRRAEAMFAPAALLDLLPETERPDRVLALCTPRAKDMSWPRLEQTLAAKCPVEPVDVSDGDAQEDVNSYLTQVSGAIPSNRKIELTVDVTHGYRHFSFLTYIVVLYLAALRGVRVRGAYYGLLRHNGPSPFLDLRPLLGLPRWLHALEVLHDTGSTLPLAAALDVDPHNQSARSIARELSQFSDGYLSGLPLESGRAAGQIREQRLKPLKKLLERDHCLPLAAELVERLDRLLAPFALAESVSGNGWKQRVTLSKDELERQARIIDDLLRHGNIATALGLMNEWAVSWSVWLLGYKAGWLDYPKARRRAAGRLDAIEAVGRDLELKHELTDEQRSLGEFWGRLRELRNAYAHHGMRPQIIVGDPKVEKTLACIRAFWEGTLRSCPDVSLSLGESRGRILISPIGLRPGVLFSALQACRADGHDSGPTVCLAICSHETERLITEAAQHAGFAGKIESLLLEDPYGGRPEIQHLVNTARKRFIGADEVFVNVTGGTTLMGLAAEALAVAARKLACPVRRFGLIDRRPPEQQDTDPYRTGEPFWLDAPEGADVDRD